MSALREGGGDGLMCFRGGRRRARRFPAGDSPGKDAGGIRRFPPASAPPLGIVFLEKAKDGRDHKAAFPEQILS